MTDEERAARIRQLAAELHDAIEKARDRGLSVHWHMVQPDTYTNPMAPPRFLHPGDRDFVAASIEISRTTTL